MNKDAFAEWQDNNFNQLAEDFIKTDGEVYNKFSLWCIDEYINHVVDRAEHYKEAIREKLKEHDNTNKE